MDFEQFELAKKISIPPLCQELAEDIGIQIGDGSISLWKRDGINGSYKVQVYGDIKEDAYYLLNFVKPLKERLFNVHVNSGSNNAAGTLFLTIYSKNLVYFYNLLGLQTGRKVDIRIPDFVFQNRKFEASCLRGLMDTDGSLAFSKGERRTHSNPVIHFTSKGKFLAKQVCGMLDDLEFSYSTDFDSKQYDARTGKTYVKSNVYVSGKKSLEKWMSIVGFNNPARMTRYLVYKKLGYCVPKTTIHQRLNMLEK
jgi:hypothetical protein